MSRGGYASLNLSYNVGDDPEAVRTNLQNLRETIPLSAPLYRVAQVHGSHVVSIEEMGEPTTESLNGPPALEADGIIATTGDALLAVQTADCAPVLLADPQTRIVSAVHAGWKGNARGIIRKAVRKMSHAGAHPANIVAAIGPCICLACYEVGEEVAKCFPESADPIKGKPGKHLLDLSLAITVSLIGAGLSDNNIDSLGRCTRCEKESFFSYRRDGAATGRMLGLISAAR